MTLFLAIETATDYGSVAIGEPGSVAAELSFTDRRHASALMPAIVEALQRAGGRFDDISGFVVADGPGSFTGLRIGFSTAKGLLLELGSATFYTVPSLLGLAYGARHLREGPVAALFDALRGDVFGAVYRFEHQSAKCEMAPTIGTIAELQERCATTPATVVGDGALLHGESARKWAGSEPIGPPSFVPKASALLHLLALDGAARRVENPTTFEPEYGRLAEAQVRLENAERAKIDDI